MAVRTPAEQTDYLIQAGADRFVETFLSNMKFMAQGGRTPGLTLPSKEELRAFYTNTTDEYWAALKATDPKGAESQLQQWKAADNG